MADPSLIRPVQSRSILRNDALALLLLLSLLASHAWTAWILPPFNSDHLGCDASHHAILIECQSRPDPAERAFLADALASYPQTSHWIAARWMPLLGNDPYKAMRAVSAASLLFMLIFQFALFRLALPTGALLLALCAWQLLCYMTGTADTQLYCKAYFFSQGVGLAAVWPAIYWMARPAASPRGRMLQIAAAGGLGTIAFLCHLVSGAGLVGGLVLTQLWHCWREPRREWPAALLLLGVAAFTFVLGLGQIVYLGGQRHADGLVPVRNFGLLILWLPLLLTGLAWRVRTLASQPAPADRVLDFLLGVLLASALLHGLCAIEWLAGKSALYAVEKFYYVLFPIGTMFGLLLAIRLLRERQPVWLPVLRSWPLRLAGAGLTLLFAFLTFGSFFTNELRSTALTGAAYSQLSNPVHAARRLAQGIEPPPGVARSTWRSDWIYVDRDLPQATVFVNVVGLRRQWSDAFAIRHVLIGWLRGENVPLASVTQEIAVGRVVLPNAVDVSAPRQTALSHFKDN